MCVEMTTSMQRQLLQAKQHSEVKQKSPYRIAIIGGGPKGIYGFERLAAQFKQHPPSEPVKIHIFNRNKWFGAGDIYRPDQPEYLLMNVCVGAINMWIDEIPLPIVPEPLSFFDWLQKSSEEQSRAATDYAPRAVVGRYLEAGFKAIATHLPPGVYGKYFVGEVVDLCPVESMYAIVLQKPDGTQCRLEETYKHILLATGHPRRQETVEQRIYRKQIKRISGVGWIPFPYPVHSQLACIPTDSTVGIQGLGLTFVDTVLALTQGRGGIFTRDITSDSLQYHPSGFEPSVIYPFSRSGLPMRPRGPVSGVSQTKLQFFTQERIQELLHRMPKQKIDFVKDIWPLIEQDIMCAFYTIEFQNKGWVLEARGPLSYPAIRKQIEHFHQVHPEITPFRVMDLLEPLREQSFATAEAFHIYVVERMRTTIAEAKQGEAFSPWMAAIAVWREAAAPFSTLFRSVGLTPSSHRIFDTFYRRLLTHITYGPPIINMEKMLAVAEAGLLSFCTARNACVKLYLKKNGFILQSEKPYSRHSIQYLINARIPKTSLTHDDALLYRNLLKRGMITHFENRDTTESEQAYQPGCLCLISDTGIVIDARGLPNTKITVTGTPTEGIFFDNDSLSRTRNNVVSSWAARLRKYYKEGVEHL
ncbi:MAG: 2,3-diaminopropionate biosynthesis protein SbnA [Chloroflexi bacterium AL-W]|nr:2,3-diaminopropionate biosynthesis protein SbnA [Chloroflexi bacterium AL-N1]NOK68091.1 2,3-diaminopropionate biosynthesis protein SbnA [Chloroflexi bacterium AL-N10]NOK73431.1 2,3-diaminopropionate biosynthesis protein SbnA [Chloroflexi bacterium AL-N5]NOK83345.1 2,3-diaminopropionate biosynthesis protein SbnA [Chloroflexi bacterium AL-W]NOK87762.1 2,3-diaminopropionate biosynthesis protein SbnA [Chloroflexi bacterium AL-N15]